MKKIKKREREREREREKATQEESNTYCVPNIKLLHTQRWFDLEGMASLS